MTTKTIPRWHIALDTKALDDLARGNLAASIQKVAQQSALIQLPEISASVTSLGKKAVTLKAFGEAVASDEKQLKTDITAREAARSALDVELVTLKSLVVRDAKSEGDVTGMGFSLLSTTTSRAKPDAPVIVQKPGKQHGKTRVAVAGKIRGRFVAESSPDPIATPAAWASLPGNGKERILTGATGTKLWVRFAQVRYGLQSDWSTPLLVTIP
jgi:hypothetical protein